MVPWSEKLFNVASDCVFEASRLVVGFLTPWMYPAAVSSCFSRSKDTIF